MVPRKGKEPKNILSGFYYAIILEDEFFRMINSVL